MTGPRTLKASGSTRPIQTIVKTVAEPESCSHPSKEPRYRTISNGARVCFWQCLVCGFSLGHVRRDEVTAREQARWTIDFDEDLKAEGERRLSDAWDRWRSQQNQLWWTEYDDYLQSDSWKARRRERLILDNFRCQAVLSGCAVSATEVHHLSYQHLGNEPLFELISVCRSCHDQITAMDRARRKAAA